MMRYSRLVLGMVAILVVTSASAAEEKALHVYNWSDYIADDTVSKFEKETGIKVTYDVYDSNESLEAKLLAGHTGYDVVVPSGDFLARQIKADIYRKLDKSKLPNWKNLDKEILERARADDPENQYGMPYMWGTTGLAYNVKMIQGRMPNAPSDSWAMLFDPQVIQKFADCGVTFLDAPGEVFAAALNYLGMDPNGHDPKNLEKALEMLLKVRRYIKYFHSSRNIDDLANGKTCLAMGWSGDMYIARDRAEQANQGVEIKYVIPKEGAMVWIDSMAIPADAPHPANALKFLNFILKPDINAAIVNNVWYASADAAATKYVNKDIANDPSIYPPPEVKKKLFSNEAPPADYARLLKRAFTKLTTGE